MFGSKRPGKRSIVGTKVCAVFDEQFYRPGSIQSVQMPAEQCQEQTYSVVFDEGGCGVYKEHQLIGPGFRSLCADQVKTGQKIYLTHNNREVKGIVLGLYPVENKEETLKYWMVGISNDVNITVKVKLEDIRLMESRKSARLSDQDTDYTRMADVNENKKRSNVIDVPHSSYKQSKFAPIGINRKRDIEIEVMDENMAAMVLTSLSHNPLSYAIENSPDSSPNEYSCSSPNDSLLSQSAPSSITHPSNNSFNHFYTHHKQDYLSNYGSNSFDFSEEDIPFEITKRTVYQCTWRGCNQIYNTCNGIEKHIRFEHLGPTADSDREEEFYYTELEFDAAIKNNNFFNCKSIQDDSNDEEIDVTNVRRKCQSESFNNINPYNPIYDHNYQKKACEHFSASIPSHTSFHLGSNNLRKDIDNNNIKNNTNNSHKSSTLRNDTFHYNSRSKRHSFNNCISNRRYDSYFDNHTLRNRNKNKHSTTKDDSEADELSKSLPWTFSEKMDVDFISDLDEKKDKTEVSKASTTLPTHRHAKQFSLTSVSTSQRKSHTEVKKCRKVYGLDNKAAWCTQCKWKKACSRFHHKNIDQAN